LILVIPIHSRANGLGPVMLPSNSTDYKDYLEIINKLPEEDKPSFFGLPANIQRSYQRTQSTATINQLRTLMRSVDGASKFEREKWNTELAPILNLWKKLNQGSSLLQMKLAAPGSESSDGGGSNTPRGSQVDPVKAFVQLEFYNAVSLLQKVHKSLVGLSKVIRGTALLDEAVSKLADFLMKQETPSSWQKSWEGPEDPMDYIKVIVAKVNRVEKWSAKANSLLQANSNEEPLDLSDLFHPDTFFGAFRQATARHYSVSMESLKLINSWSTGSSNRGGVATTAKLPIRVTGIIHV
jgi:dynein heavy chain 2